MTTLPVAGRFSDGTLTNAQAKTAQNDMLAAMRELVGGEAVSTLTIASGVVTPTRAVHLVDTEGSAASDDLDRISNVNHPDGRIVIIGTVDAARDVTVRHGLATSGNNLRILLAGGVDLVLSDPSMRLVLQRRGTDWVELDRSYGSQTAAERAAIGAAASGAVTASGLTMATARFLGRTSASTGAIEELDATAVRNALGSAFKDPVRVASTASVTISGPGVAIDGVTLSVGDRVLLKDQSTTSANGIYVFQGSSSSMTRAADADAWAELPGAVVAVLEGTTNADRLYLCTSNGGGTLGTTALAFARVDAGVGAIVTADGAAGTNRGLRISTSGTVRWDVIAETMAEAGANAGSNFALARYSDAGSLIDVALSINRATGALAVGGATPATGYTSAGDLTLPAARNVRAKNTAKAWVNFNGTGTVSIRDQLNVSSITDNGVGDYTINFTNAMADANYATGITASKPTADTTTNDVFSPVLRGTADQSTSSVRVVVKRQIGGGTLDSGSDPTIVNVLVFGA